jgi:hypothetical protein
MLDAANETVVFFVWYAHPRPRPHKLHRLEYGQRNWNKPYAIAVKSISAEEWRETLDVLAARHPIHLCERV